VLIEFKDDVQSNVEENCEWSTEGQAKEKFEVLTYP
jgi:hypothetical protein